jgi:hypothetical protein
MLPSWNYSKEFLIRLWIRYASDVDHTAGGKLLRMYPPSGLDSFYLAAQMEQSGTPLFSYWELINGQPGPEFWGDSSPMGDTHWHKIEIYVKHNTPGATDGTVKVWLDGSLKQQGANIVSVAPGDHWYPLYLMSNWSSNPGWEHDAANHTYWDDVEVYTDLGTGATGTMSDATIRAAKSPSTPTNLRVVP